MRTYTYSVYVSELKEINKYLEEEIKNTLSYVENLKNKFYWKVYLRLRTKHFNTIIKYCDEMETVIKDNNEIINLYKEAEKLRVESLFFYINHKDYTRAIKYELYTLNDYKKYNDKIFKGHSYSDFKKECSLLKSQLCILISDKKTKNMYEDMFKENIKKNVNLPDYIVKAIKTLDIPNKDINVAMIKKYYKIAAKKYHPDKGGSIEKMQEINEAYKILKEFYKDI